MWAFLIFKRFVYGSAAKKSGVGQNRTITDIELFWINSENFPNDYWLSHFFNSCQQQ